MRRWLSMLLLVGCGVGAAQCSASGGTAAGSGGSGATGTGGSGAGLGGFAGLDSGADALGPPTGARLTGKVWGPHRDGTQALFPVPGAAVIAYPSVPAQIPEQAYCDECVALPDDVPYAISGPDGSFVLDVPVGSSFVLTTQKGQFRRMRQYTAPAAVGEVALPEDFTTLPHRTDYGAGDTIPRIALVYGDYDHIEDVFAKVGMGNEDGAYGLDWGSEAGFFDVYNNAGPGEPGHGAPLRQLIDDPARLASYHVIVFGCSYNANFSFMNDAAVQQRLRDYVWGGGKLYVSDYAMPVAEMPWHDFAWFTNPLTGGCNENDFPPTCNHGPPFDAPGSVPDTTMSAWLSSMNLLNGLELKENWDTIGGIGQGVVGRDPSTGSDLRGEPKVWVEGPWNYTDSDLTGFGEDPATWDRDSHHPFTLSWPYNCGRVLFTTYHTVGGTSGGRHPGLLPQEMILFYLLMEINVCQEQPVVH